MSKIKNMRLLATVRFNRPVTDQDKVSPGSYEVVFEGADGEKGYQFDFQDFYGYKSLKNPAEVQMVCENLDEQSFRNLTGVGIGDLGSIKEIREFFVWTGEANDPGSDLAPAELLGLSLEVMAEGRIRNLFATPESMKALNSAWKEEQRKQEEIKNLFWMNRNKQGLEEIGYLLTMEQLKEEVPDAYEFFSKGCDLGGYGFADGYRGDDTFLIQRVKSEKEVKDLLIWADFDMEESHATGGLDYDYPAFVDEKYRLGRRVYNITGYTDAVLPTSGCENPTVKKWMERLGLTEEQICFKPTIDDRIAAELSNILEDNGTIALDEYKGVLQRYGAEVPKFVCYDVELPATVTVIAAEGDLEGAEAAARSTVLTGDLTAYVNESGREA